MVVVEVVVVVDVEVEVDEVVVVLNAVVDVELVAVVEEVVAACSSTATSSDKSPPPLAVQLQVTWPGAEATAELDAPVIPPGTLTFHSCAQLGAPRVTPPHIEGRSRTQLLEYCVVRDTVGLPGAVSYRVTTVGIGIPWSIPEKAYAPITTDEEPAMATTISPVPVGLCRYQNSASLL